MNEIKPGDVVYTDGVGYGVVIGYLPESAFGVRFWNQKWTEDGFYDWDRFDRLQKIGVVTKEQLDRMPAHPVEMLAIALDVDLRHTVVFDGVAFDTFIHSTEQLRADILSKLQEAES